MWPIPRQLSFDGRHLLCGGQPVDVVYRRLLVADILARPEDCAALLAAYTAGAVCVVNSLRSGLLHGKGLFALLHDPALLARLPQSVGATIRRHIPWTGILGDRPQPGTPADLREQARAAPHQWVLKPICGHGGQGVVLGWQVDQRTWSAALDQADAHVLQRRVPISRQRFPDARCGYALRDVQTSLDPFLIGGRLAGFLCRLTDGLGNVSEGASQVPVFIV